MAVYGFTTSGNPLGREQVLRTSPDRVPRPAYV